MEWTIDEQESVTALMTFISLSAREGQRSDSETHGKRHSIGRRSSMLFGKLMLSMGDGWGSQQSF